MTAAPGVGTLEQLRVPKMSELVSQHLRRQIVRGEVMEGDALAPEAELMKQFGVSRPTLREAFRVLESERLISVHRGARGGARVRVPDGAVAARYAGLVLEYRGATLRDVYDARNVIEPPCVHLLALRRTKADLARLEASVAQARAALDEPRTFIRVHNDFHALITELAGNETLAVLNGMVRHIIDQSSLAHVEADAGTPANVRANHKGFRAHERLVALIEARDPEAAEDLWRRHLTEAEDYLLSGPRLKTVLDLLG